MDAAPLATQREPHPTRWSTAVTGGVAAMVNGDREVESRGDRGGERCARRSAAAVFVND